MVQGDGSKSAVSLVFRERVSVDSLTQVYGSGQVEPRSGFRRSGKYRIRRFSFGTGGVRVAST